MTKDLNLFFDNFDKLAESPGGVQKLRELILQLAVQGKLVPQNPNDESASELLNKIKAEKEKLIKEGKIKKQKPLPPIEPDEISYKLPKGWEWVRLGSISYDIHYGYTASANHEHKDVRLLRITDIQSNTVNWNTVPGCEINQNDVGKYSLSNGDILIARTGGTIGKSYLVKDLSVCAVFASYLIRMLPCKGILPSYCKKFIESPLYWEQLYDKSMGTGQPNVNATSLKSLITPLPPLSEQKRIVAKVDELMALCDELEAKQEKARHGRIVLHNSAIDHLFTAGTTKDFDRIWQIICENFDLLYNDPQNVNKLRQAVLQLAVQGKLAPQNPKDKPASELLKKIKAEKEKLTKEGKLKKHKPIPLIEPDEIPYKLPAGWEWVRFGRITLCRDGERIPLSRSVRENRKGPYDYYGASGVIDRIDDYLFEKPLLLIGEDGANLINRSTPIAFIAKGKYWVNNHAHVLDALNYDILRYIELFINAIDLKPYVTGTAQPKMNQAKMNSIKISMPPLEEQKRIVAKVDELMALCDQLEEKIKQSQDKSEKLMAATIHHLLVA